MDTLLSLPENNWQIISLILSGLDISITPDTLADLTKMPREQILSILTQMEKQGLAERTERNNQEYYFMPYPCDIPKVFPSTVSEHTTKTLPAILLSYIKGDYLAFLTEGLEIFRQEQNEKKMLQARCIYAVIAYYIKKMKLPLDNRSLCLQIVKTGTKLQMLLINMPWSVPIAFYSTLKLRGIAIAIGDKATTGTLDLCMGLLLRGVTHLINTDFCCKLMEEGADIVFSLNDDTLSRQSSGMICWYYYMKGDYAKSISYAYSTQYLPEVENNFDFERCLYAYAGYSAAAIHEYDIAVNLLTLAINRAVQHREWLDVDGLRAVLCTFYLWQKNYDGFFEIVDSIVGMSHSNSPTYASSVVQRTLAYYFYKRGLISQSYACYKNALKESIALRLMHNNYTGTSFCLDLLLAYKKAGYPSPTEMPLEMDLEQSRNSPVQRLSATAWRVSGELAIYERGEADPEAFVDIQKSLTISRRTNMPLEIAKCLLLLTSIYQHRGDMEHACTAATEAWELCNFHKEPSWPAAFDELRLSHSNGNFLHPATTLLINFFNAMQQQDMDANETMFYNKLLFSALAAFGANRGGIFTAEPVLRCISSAHLPDRILRGAEYTKQASVLFEAKAKKHSVWRQMPHQPDSTESGNIVVVLTVDAAPQLFLYLEGPLRSQLHHTLGKGIFSILESYLATEISIYKKHLRTIQKKQAVSVDKRPPLDSELLFCSGIMQNLVQKVDGIADKDTTVLILGESGAGKELIAKRIHAQSGCPGQFIAVNLACTSTELFESELFGHEKGAFTGANYQKIGLIELAHNGTLFIDEVGDIPAPMQVKLLRVLQEKSFTRVGGTRVISSNFRLVAATNRNLEKDVLSGRFRQDLYYRLSVVVFQLPPLRERKEDIILLAEYYLQKFSRRHQMTPEDFSPALKKQLLDYTWPGNVRELRNYIERYVLLRGQGEDAPSLAASIVEKNAEEEKTTSEASSSLVEKKDLQQKNSSIKQTSSTKTEEHTKLAEPTENTAEPIVSCQTALQSLFCQNLTMEDLQKAYFEYAYEQMNGQVGGENGIASFLKLSRTATYNWIDKLRLKECFVNQLVRKRS